MELDVETIYVTPIGHAASEMYFCPTPNRWKCITCANEIFSLNVLMMNRCYLKTCRVSRDFTRLYQVDKRTAKTQLC